MADNEKVSLTDIETDEITAMMQLLLKINSKFDKLDKKLDERAEMMNKGFNKLKDVLDKQDEKWERDKYRLKEDTGESNKVSGCNCLLYTSRCV